MADLGSDDHQSFDILSQFDDVNRSIRRLRDESAKLQANDQSVRLAHTGLTKCYQAAICNLQSAHAHIEKLTMDLTTAQRKIADAETTILTLRAGDRKNQHARSMEPIGDLTTAPRKRTDLENPHACSMEPTGDPTTAPGKNADAVQPHREGDLENAPQSLKKRRKSTPQDMESMMLRMLEMKHKSQRSK